MEPRDAFGLSKRIDMLELETIDAEKLTQLIVKAKKFT